MNNQKTWNRTGTFEGTHLLGNVFCQQPCLPPLSYVCSAACSQPYRMAGTALQTVWASPEATGVCSWTGSHGTEMLNSSSISWATEMRHQINILLFSLQQWPLSSPVFFILPYKGNCWYAPKGLPFSYFVFLYPQLSLYVLIDSPKERHHFCSQCLAKMDWGATKGMVKNLGLPSWLRKLSSSQAAPVGQKYITWYLKPVIQEKIGKFYQAIHQWGRKDPRERVLSDLIQKLFTFYSKCSLKLLLSLKLKL